jgi:hypothetical protein
MLVPNLSQQEKYYEYIQSKQKSIESDPIDTIIIDRFYARRRLA